MFKKFAAAAACCALAVTMLTGCGGGEPIGADRPKMSWYLLITAIYGI